MFLRARDTQGVTFFRIVLCLISLQITEFWGFPCPGPGEGLALKVAVLSEPALSCRVTSGWIMKWSWGQRGQTKARSSKMCRESRGRARAGQQNVCACGRGRRKDSTRTLRAGLSGHAAIRHCPHEPGCHPRSQPRTEPHQQHPVLSPSC